MGLTVTIENLDVVYDSDSLVDPIIHVFKDFTARLDMEVGKITMLYGANGVGKSVLARLVAGQMVSQLDKRKGDVRFYIDGRGIKRPKVVYLPQSFEGFHDRFASDLFLSIASIGKRIVSSCDCVLRRMDPEPGGKLDFIALFRDGKLPRREFDQPCDQILRSRLVYGCLLAAEYSSVDLVIVDEPFSQHVAGDRDGLREYFRRREGGPPLLVIAHPGQTPDEEHAGFRLRRTNEGKTIEKFVPSTACGSAAQALNNSVVAWFTVKISLGLKEVASHKIWEFLPNALPVPEGIAPGLLASLLVRALETGREQTEGGWSVKCSTNSDDPKVIKGVELLPSDAQRAVVSGLAPLSSASLFNRWEDAPTHGMPPVIDRRRLNEQWFAAGRDILPLQHDDPNLLGSQLSGGNRQLLALRTVLHPLPEALITVMAFSGLDEENSRRAELALRHAAAAGTCVITVGDRL